MKFEIDARDVNLFRSLCLNYLDVIDSDLRYYELLLESGRFSREDVESDVEYLRLFRSKELLVCVANQITSAIEENRCGFLP